MLCWAILIVSVGLIVYFSIRKPEETAAYIVFGLVVIMLVEGLVSIVFDITGSTLETRTARYPLIALVGDGSTSSFWSAGFVFCIGGAGGSTNTTPVYRYQFTDKDGLLYTRQDNATECQLRIVDDCPQPYVEHIWRVSVAKLWVRKLVWGSVERVLTGEKWIPCVPRSGVVRIVDVDLRKMGKDD